MKERYPEGFPARQESPKQGPMLTMTEPIILAVRAPPRPKLLHRERTITLVGPLEIVVESNARLASIVVTVTIRGGDSGRPFTLKT